MAEVITFKKTLLLTLAAAFFLLCLGCEEEAPSSAPAGDESLSILTGQQQRDRTSVMEEKIFEYTAEVERIPLAAADSYNASEEEYTFHLPALDLSQPDSAFYFELITKETAQCPYQSNLYRMDGQEAVLLDSFEGVSANISGVQAGPPGLCWMVEQQYLYYYDYDATAPQQLPVTGVRLDYSLRDDYIAYRQADSGVTQYYSLISPEESIPSLQTDSPTELSFSGNEQLYITSGDTARTLHFRNPRTQRTRSYPLPDVFPQHIVSISAGNTEILFNVALKSPYTQITDCYLYNLEDETLNHLLSPLIIEDAVLLEDQYLVFLSEGRAFLYDLTTQCFTAIRELQGYTFSSMEKALGSCVLSGRNEALVPIVATISLPAEQQVTLNNNLLQQAG